MDASSFVLGFVVGMVLFSALCLVWAFHALDDAWNDAYGLGIQAGIEREKIDQSRRERVIERLRRIEKGADHESV